MLVTGEYPQAIRDFLVDANRYTLRVEAYVGFLTDRYPAVQPLGVRQRLARRRWRWTLTAGPTTGPAAPRRAARSQYSHNGVPRTSSPLMTGMYVTVESRTQ